MRANFTAYFHLLTLAQRERKSLTGGGPIRKLLVREKALNFHIMALCVNQLKEARGRRGWVLLCMSGASFLCVHSQIVSRVDYPHLGSTKTICIIRLILFRPAQMGR
jgi:hypothetical protein